MAELSPQPNGRETDSSLPASAPRLLKFIVWFQIPLILLTVGIYLYVWNELKPLFAQRQQLRSEIEALQAEKKTMSESVAVLRKEVDAYSTALNEVRTEVQTSAGKQLQLKTQQLVPITAQVKIRAAVRKTGQSAKDGSPLYEFSIWLEGPADTMSRIKTVRYEFNHPTFEDKIQESSDRRTQFRVSYIGWGCLSSLIVDIIPVNQREAKPPRVDFNMCSALGW